jgi:hypothetical protein
MIAWQDQKRKLHFGVLDTGSWRSQGSNSRQKIDEMQNHDLISISEFQIPGVGGVKDTHDKNDEIAKCERSEHVKDSISEFHRPGNQRSKEL